MESTTLDLKERSSALVTTSEQERSFAEYAEARDKWLATPIAHNTSLARGGFPFTIIECAERTFEATELDTARGYKIGDPVEKIAYLCMSQMDWWHYAVGEDDTHYPKDEMFIILFNQNPIRQRDFERIQKLLKDGLIHNICLQEYPNKTKGFNPAHGLVTASQWKSLM
jgi:hypothetical protein